MTLQIQTVARDGSETFDDDAEGKRLVGWVHNALARGGAPPAAVVLRPERTDVALLAPVHDARLPLRRFVAALARSTIDGGGPASAVGVIGTVRARRRGQDQGPAVPLAIAFLEWPDNRWWYWKGLVASDGRSIREGTEVVQRAVDGDPMPPVFGRWWALGRRLDITMHLSRQVLTPGESDVVH